MLRKFKYSCGMLIFLGREIKDYRYERSKICERSWERL